MAHLSFLYLKNAKSSQQLGISPLSPPIMLDNLFLVIYINALNDTKKPGFALILWHWSI